MRRERSFYISVSSIYASARLKQLFVGPFVDAIAHAELILIKLICSYPAVAAVCAGCCAGQFGLEPVIFSARGNHRQVRPPRRTDTDGRDIAVLSRSAVPRCAHDDTATPHGNALIKRIQFKGRSIHKDGFAIGRYLASNTRPVQPCLKAARRCLHRHRTKCQHDDNGQ